MSEHRTPGPWAVLTGTDIITEDGAHVGWADSWAGVSPEAARANACLMAAAPDLLAASIELLRRYVSLVESGDCGFWNPETEDEVKAMRAAIAKAKGG